MQSEIDALGRSVDKLEDRLWNQIDELEKRVLKLEGAEQALKYALYELGKHHPAIESWYWDDYR